MSRFESSRQDPAAAALLDQDSRDAVAAGDFAGFRHRRVARE
jgi:hypothetical protein